MRSVQYAIDEHGELVNFPSRKLGPALDMVDSAPYKGFCLAPEVRDCVVEAHRYIDRDSPARDRMPPNAPGGTTDRTCAILALASNWPPFALPLGSHARESRCHEADWMSSMLYLSV